MALHFASCCNIQYNQIVNYLNVLELDPFRPKLSIKCQRWAKRFDTYVGVLQSRVEWDESIILPLSPYLMIVKNVEGIYAVKCLCGYELGDYRENWKTNALINVRDTEESLGEIYPGPRCPDPEKNEIREFFCPGCAVQLEVDAVPPGYPILVNFEPNLEVFYRDWLGRELP
ncbi:MAG: acetone carboxylase subunit gamma [Proteobacteria bacterium]|nr:acetone carboxylase subunit gamma [Pseudomonadota bacterium]